MQRPEELALAPPLAQGERWAGTRKTRSREAAGGASQGAPKGRRRNPPAEEERRADARPTRGSARSAPAGNKADAPPIGGASGGHEQDDLPKSSERAPCPGGFCRSGSARYEARRRPAPSPPRALGMLKPSAPGSKGPVQKATVWHNTEQQKNNDLAPFGGPAGRDEDRSPSLSSGSPGDGGSPPAVSTVLAGARRASIGPAHSGQDHSTRFGWPKSPAKTASLGGLVARVSFPRRGFRR